MVFELASVGQLVIGAEPVVQQDSGGVAGALVVTLQPPLDLLADARNAGRSGDPRVQEVGLIRALLALAGHSYATVTLTDLVVSLPRMSITFTTIV
jgi:hypothetical protein